MQGQNLLTFDNLGDVDMDPEIKNGDGSWFPVQRVINIGLNMTSNPTKTNDNEKNLISAL